MSASQTTDPGSEWFLALDFDARVSADIRPTGFTAEGDRVRAERRLEKWARHPLYLRDPDAFLRRLSADGLDRKSVLPLLGENAASLAARVGDLSDDLKQTASLLYQETDQAAMGRAEQAIAAVATNPTSSAVLRLVLPFLAHALQSLEQNLSPLAKAPFHVEDASMLWARRLPSLLTPLFLRTLALEVNIARMKGELCGDTPEARFSDFVNQLCQPERRRAFFCEYCVLARQVNRSLAHWVDFGIEVFSRLSEDWPEICRVFFPIKSPGILLAVEASDGDGHRHGRSVLKLVFDDGEKLIYKPRSLSLDDHFQSLLIWVNDRLRDAPGLPPFRTLRVLDRGNWGWCEFIETQSCTSQDEVQRFFLRQGGYLGLLYALQAIDFHSENLIACGEHPVLVDLEALFHPDDLDLSTGDTHREPATKAWLTSVLRMGLLPERQDSSEDVAGFDISGLGDRTGQVMAEPVPVINRIGTDEMHVAYERLALETQNSIPVIDGVRVEAARYLAQILAGFEKMYRLILRYREELLAGPMSEFANDPIRFISVPTIAYDRILKTSFHPDYLRDAAERERIVDRVWRHPRPEAGLEQVFRAEKADLLAGDIPYFWTHADSRDLRDSCGHIIPEILSESGYLLARQRLQQMGEADMERQIWAIRASFATIQLGHGEGSWPGHAATTEEMKPAADDLLGLARAVGDRVLRLAYKENDCAGWLGVNLIRDREWRVMPVSFDLYNGLSGIALFLAHLGRLTGEPSYTEMARAAANSIQRQFKTRHGFADPLPVGVYGGLSAPIYAFTHLAHLWNEPEWLDRAESYVPMLAKHVKADRGFDILDGSAGCILGLLTLYRAKPSMPTLKMARVCGNHLLAHAQRLEAVPTGLFWHNRIPAIAPLTGFSHGVAGISTALVSLGRATGEARFLDAGLAALEYERSNFAADEGNWPDFRVFGERPEADSPNRPAETQHFMTTWCHGAPGIGMSRLMLRGFLDDPVLDDEIDTAVRTTLRNGFGLNHSLCHGDLGNLDLLQAALTGSERAEVLAKLAGMVVQSIRRDGWLTGIPLGIESPGLMTGIAGIGYGLLRLLDPECVPSVLMLEDPGHRRTRRSFRGADMSWRDGSVQDSNVN